MTNKSASKAKSSYKPRFLDMKNNRNAASKTEAPVTIP